MKKIFITLTTLLLTITVSNASLADLAKKPRQAKKEKQTKKTKQQPQKATQQKEELKVWKQRKDSMQPLQFKDLVEENHRLKTSNRQLQEEVKLTQEQVEKLVKLKVKIDALRKQRARAQHTDDIVGEDDEDQTEDSFGKKGENVWLDDNYEDLDALFSLPQQENAATNSDVASPDKNKGVDYYHLAQSIIGLEEFGKEDWAVDESGAYYIRGVIFKVQIGAYRQRDLSGVLERAQSQEMFEQEQSEDVNKYTLRHFRDYRKADTFKKELRAMGLKDAWIVAFQDGKRVPLKAVLKEVIRQKKS